MRTEITRKDEEKFLRLKIGNNSCFENPFSFDEVINNIAFGKIPLEVTEDDGTKIIDENQFNEIRRVIPFLLKIIDKPRSFIKSLEEKVPVEIAKSINHKAISKLSQDSNDWYARTILSVKPKNIVSDINEETIDLYENRFICSLTDKIASLVATRRQYYQNELKNYDDNTAIFAMDKDYHTTSSFPFFNKLSKTSNSFISDNSYRKKLEEELESIFEVEKKIRLIKRSDFYRYLHKKRKVADPIQKTNILMFEFNYNQAYKLWKYLNQYHEDEILKNDIDDDTKDTNYCYLLYCFLCVLSVLHDLGFSEQTHSNITFTDKSIILEKKLLFRKDKGTINLSVEKNSIKLGYRNEDLNGKVDEFIFYPDFIDFERMSRSQIDECTEKMLNKLTSTEKFSTVTSRYSLVSINLNRCSEDNTYSDRVYRRFYGIGNNFSPNEKEINLRNWGDYKAGIVIVTPVRLRDNFLKIEKIINYHILKSKDLSSFKTQCPICGGSHIISSGNNYICHNCSHLISITYCNNCDKEHKRPITWVKYGDDNFLKREDVVRGDFAENKYYDKMSKIEIIMGENATTTFELEKEISSWKLKTICPHCGLKLGDNK